MVKRCGWPDAYLTELLRLSGQLYNKYGILRAMRQILQSTGTDLQLKSKHPANYIYS